MAFSLGCTQPGILFCCAPICFMVSWQQTTNHPERGCKMDRRKLIDTAQGKLEPDLVLKNGRIIQVLTGEILEGDIAVKDGWIAGVGRYDGPHAAEPGRPLRVAGLHQRPLPRGVLHGSAGGLLRGGAALRCHHTDYRPA